MVSVKKIFLLLLLISSAFAFVHNTSDYSFSYLSLDVNENGGFTLKGDFNVVPDVNDTRVYIMGPNKDLNVVSSSNKIYFDERGYFLFANESGSIDVKGQLFFEQSTSLVFIPPVMRLTVNTPTYSDVFYSLTGKSVTVYKYKYKPSEQHVTPTYNIFLEKFDKKSFSYVLDVQNPGQEIRLNLRNGEAVSSVDGARYKITGQELVIYPESENRIRVYGTLPSSFSSFNPGLGVPGYVSVQYPSDFEVISSGATEVDASVVPGIEYRYPNKVFYEVYPSSSIYLQIQELDSFPSLVFAVDDVRNTVSISENGAIIQNTNFRFSNTGLEYASFDVKGLQPLYSSLNGRPTLLTKKNEKLYLAVEKNSFQNAEFITLDKKPELFPVSYIELDVPRIDYPITTFQNTIYYPSDYEVLYATEGTGFGWEWFLLSILVMTLFLYIVVPGFKAKKRFLTALLLAVAIDLLSIVSMLFMFFALIGYAYALYKKFKEPVKKALGQHKKAWVVGVVAVLGLIVIASIAVVFVVVLSTTFFTRYSSTAQVQRHDIARAPLADEMNIGAIKAPSEELGMVTQKEILPVKLSLPMYSNRINIASQMITQDKPLKVSVLLVHTWLMKTFYAIIGLLLLYFAWRRTK